jgi:hypothetical protein
MEGAADEEGSHESDLAGRADAGAAAPRRVRDAELREFVARMGMLTLQQQLLV